MGQFMNTPAENKIVFDESDNNGMIINNKYIPEELLSHMFCYYADGKSLLNCQLVCKRWNFLITSYVWRKKAEITVGCMLPINEQINWKDYYMIYKKNPFGRNLVKNHSGEEGIQKHWLILRNGGDGWKVECPPTEVPLLPSVPVFEDKQQCFVTSYHECSKQQIINLVDEGLSPYILDNLQPPIVVSEWYSCRWDCPATYRILVELFDEKNAITMDTFEFRDSLTNERQNTWYNVTYEFNNYGKGLRTIVFRHGGCDNSFWAGHYGPKMAGACIQIKVPENRSSRTDEDMSDS